MFHMHCNVFKTALFPLLPKPAPLAAHLTLLPRSPSKVLECCPNFSLSPLMSRLQSLSVLPTSPYSTPLSGPRPPSLVRIIHFDPPLVQPHASFLNSNCFSLFVNPIVASCHLLGRFWLLTVTCVALHNLVPAYLPKLQRLTPSPVSTLPNCPFPGIGCTLGLWTCCSLCLEHHF